jgi:hypothetical protein
MILILTLAAISLIALWALGTAQAAYRLGRRLEVAQKVSQIEEEALEIDPSADQPQDLIRSGQAFRCNSCREIRSNPPEFLTKVDLEIPFLDHTLPIHVYLCQECVSAQAVNS